MPACLGVPGTMICEAVPLVIFFAVSSSFAAWAVLHEPH
jgi:hypothetical protein